MNNLHEETFVLDRLHELEILYPAPPFGDLFQAGRHHEKLRLGVYVEVLGARRQDVRSKSGQGHLGRPERPVIEGEGCPDDDEAVADNRRPQPRRGDPETVLIPPKTTHEKNEY